MGLRSDTASTLSNLTMQGVLHAGGILLDAPLAQQTPRHIRTVFAPKANGLQSLLQVNRMWGGYQC